MYSTSWPWNWTARARLPRYCTRRGGCFAVSLPAPGGGGRPARNPGGGGLNARPPGGVGALGAF
eukprot:9989309-Lingulodinium_polyedra.AAC.1